MKIENEAQNEIEDEEIPQDDGADIEDLRKKNYSLDDNLFDFLNDNF